MSGIKHSSRLLLAINGLSIKGYYFFVADNAKNKTKFQVPDDN
jgi:hypothetical protein